MKNQILILSLIISTLFFSCKSKESFTKNDLELDGLKGKVKKMSRTHFEVDNNINYAIEVSEYNIDGYLEYKGKKGGEEVFFVRDGRNNIIEKTEVKFPDGIAEKWLTKNKYNNDNKLIESKVIIDNKIYSADTFEYDFNGNVTSDILIYPQNGGGSSTFYKYKYDNNNIIESIEENPSSKFFTKKIFKYDDNNNIIYESEYDIKNEEGITKKSKYDDNNNLIEYIYSYKNNKPFITKYIYSNNNLIEEKVFNQDSSLKLMISYENYIDGNWTKQISSDNTNIIVKREIEYYSDSESSTSKSVEATHEVKTEEKINVNDNLKTLNEIELTLIDGSLKKAKLYLGEPDKYEYGFGHYSKGFAIYYNKVSNQNGQPKHLVLFLRENGRQWGNNAQIEEIYALDDNEKACFGIHCLKIKDKEIYTNALDLIVDKKYKSIN